MQAQWHLSFGSGTQPGFALGLLVQTRSARRRPPNPAALSNSFLLRSSLRATPSVMIRTILSHQGMTRPLLIFRRPLGMIDDENLHGALLRFQFQTKLLLNCRENGRPGEFGRYAVSA